MSAEEKDFVVVGRNVADIDGKDVVPFRLGRVVSSRPSRTIRRSVFQTGSDWASPSIVVILDAFQNAVTAQVSDYDLERSALSLLRSAGSTELDSSMADVFDTGTQNLCPHPFDIGQKECGVLLQCRGCHRPVLVTRMLGHLKRCEVSKVRDGLLSESKEPVKDEEMRLIEAPYLPGLAQSELKKVRGLKRTSAVMASETGRLSKRSGRKRASPVWLAEEEDWEAAITPVMPRKLPRTSSFRRRRVSLPEPLDSPAQRKRLQNMEKKALCVAQTAGLHQIDLRQQDVSSGDPDALSQAAKQWGAGAPWSQLMQIALPIALPRASRGKSPSSRDFSGSSSNAASIPVQTVSPITNNATKSSKSDVGERSMSNTGPGPSLVGSLLWLRGQGIQELANTSLQNMDVPQLPITRSGAIFHGQTYVAQLGTFETDPRASTTIKMPLASTTQASIIPQTSNAIGRAPGTEGRSKAPSGQAAVQGTSSGSTQPQPKKQRTLKQQRPPSVANTQHFAPGVPSRPGQGISRKAATQRLPVSVGAGRVKGGGQGHEPVHRMPARTQTQSLPGFTPPSASPNSSVAAAKLTQSHAGLPRKGFRPSHGIPASQGRGISSHASVPPVSGAPANVVSTSKGSGIRQAKTRALSSSAIGSASPSVRSAGSKMGKSQSPGQASSRSTDRHSNMRNVSGTSQYDPVLLASAAAQASNPVRITSSGGAVKQRLDFQQVIAQVAAKGTSRSLREDTSSAGRQGVPEAPAKGPPPVAENVNSHLTRQGLRGLSPRSRVKQPSATVGAPQRGIPLQKGRQVARVRKEDRDSKQKNIEDQLRQADPLQLDGGPAKLEHLHTTGFVKRGEHGAALSNVSHGFYSTALAAASGQVGPAPALKGQPNLALLRMAHASQNPMVGAGAADGTPNVLQGVHDPRQITGIPVVPGVQGNQANSNMLNFLQASSMSTGLPNAGMNGGGASALPSGVLAQCQTPVLTGDAILQQLFAGRSPAVNPGPIQAAQVVRPPGQLSHAHQMARTNNMAPAQPVIPAAPATPNAALDEIDRALGIGFEEKDLLD